MCGIAGTFGGQERGVRAAIAAMRHRGPDSEGVARCGPVTLGHCRLAIIDTSAASAQPFRRGPVTLSFSGEVWNYVAIRTQLRAAGLSFATVGDTEVFAAALETWGPGALPRLDGMFAAAWTDARRPGELHLARDRFGEVPLHVALGRQLDLFGEPPTTWFASELKGLIAAGVDPLDAEDVQPGEHVVVTEDGAAAATWYEPDATPRYETMGRAAERVRALLRAGCHERAIADVPVCALLSGGIDSAAIVLFLKELMPGIVCYGAVYDQRSSDARAAREVAEFLGVELREVRVPEPTREDMEEMVLASEMAYKAQVEISWPCWHLAKRMRADGFRVTFSGEGSDELWASYGFSTYALSAGEDWHGYRKKLLRGQARKNFSRCNKVFLAHGVECRLPFLHEPLVRYALSLPREAVQAGQDPRSRKRVLQLALAGDLPERIINRPKIAFQDGIGLKDVIASVVGARPRQFYGDVLRGFARLPRRAVAVGVAVTDGAAAEVR